jgi:receptor protein-tyrosine kinase
MDVLLDGSVGLTDALCRTDIGKLTLLPAGTPHARATEVLASERMRGLLKEMAERYPDRIIIFDSPPLLAASEACVLAGAMGQVVLIVEAGKTTQTTVKEALHRIESSNVVGVLLNKGVPPGSGDYGYGYGYGYGSRS